MWLLAQMQQMHGWDYTMFLLLGFLLLTVFILFLAAVAVFVGRARSQRTET